MSNPDERPITGYLHVFRLEPKDDGTTRTAVWRQRENPKNRILYYEGVRYIDNGALGIFWRGIYPYYEGGELVTETTVAADLGHLPPDQQARCTIARTWGAITSQHLITNQGDLDTPLFHPEHWK
ncbi:hypothetical protein [Microbispora sp. NPDC049125]|uniref:hypothetical protein n=1 Tax=Microbispora sp. NPDC049125 TaxID=3154929 RepID=UPI0034668480